MARAVVSFPFLIVCGAVISGCTGGAAVGSASSAVIPRIDLVAAVPLPTYVPSAVPSVLQASVDRAPVPSTPSPLPSALVASQQVP